MLQSPAGLAQDAWYSSILFTQLKRVGTPARDSEGPCDPCLIGAEAAYDSENRRKNSPTSSVPRENDPCVDSVVRNRAERRNIIVSESAS
jgi:hypothetical protein